MPDPSPSSKTNEYTQIHIHAYIYINRITYKRKTVHKNAGSYPSLSSEDSSGTKHFRQSQNAITALEKPNCSSHLSAVTIVRPRRPRERVPVKNTTRVDYNGGPTDGQLAALLRISVYCYQPVRVHCRRSKVTTSPLCRRIISLTTASSSFLLSSSGAVILKGE